jgi:hypothetical protein
MHLENPEARLSNLEARGIWASGAFVSAGGLHALQRKTEIKKAPLHWAAGAFLCNIALTLFEFSSTKQEKN